MNNQIYRPPEYSHNRWRKEQIFVDMSTAFGIVSGGVVPNLNDEVISWSGNIKFEERVTFVHPLTNKCTLEPVEYPNNGNEAIIGARLGVGNLSNVANLLMNPNDAKLSSTVDARLPISGTNLSHARIFLGNNISKTGKVLSLHYDTAGNVIDDKVELVKVDAGDLNVLRYKVRPFNLNTKLDEDTLVVMVIYSDTDNMVMWQELTIKHNHIVANVQAAALFINSVELESAYQDPLDKSKLLVPKNLLNSSFTPRIFKNYQSGVREEVFVGTSNVVLNGWGDYLTGSPGEKFPLVLNYILTAGELSQNVDLLTGSHLTSNYEVIVIDNDLETEVKLFVIPTFINKVTGYKLDFWLYSGDRSSATKVTDKVTTSTFRGSSYGLKQQIDYSINLTDIESIGLDVFADSIDIQILGEPMANSTMYKLWYWRGDTRYYGKNLRAKITSNFGTNTLSINNYYEQYSEWLDNLYYKVSPLFDGSVSDSPPEPTHVDVLIGSEVITIDINNYWNGEVLWNASVPSTGSNVLLKWYILNDVGARLELAITSMPLEVI